MAKVLDFGHAPTFFEGQTHDCSRAIFPVENGGIEHGRRRLLLQAVDTHVSRGFGAITGGEAGRG